MLIYSEIGLLVSLAIVLTAHMLAAKTLKALTQCLHLFIKRLEAGVLHTVLPLQLLDQELAIGSQQDVSDPRGQTILEPQNHRDVLGLIVGSPP